MILKPMIRNNICINAHPEGCARETERQIEYVAERRAAYARLKGPRAVLVIGCSTGYGLATRIASAFGFGAATVGVSYEKEPSTGSTGTPGWYNNRAFDAAATVESLPSISLNGDAFSEETKARVIAAARELGLRFDLVVYSLASPVRVDPATGVMHRSVIKPIGGPYRGRTVDPFTKELSFVDVQAATEAEAADTVKVMGGEDWELWISALAAAGVLARGATTVAYSYVGPRMTWPIYRDGTIGRAKHHLEATAAKLPAAADGAAKAGFDGSPSLELSAYVSINKALVTRASAVIPVIPLYSSILFKVMKERGIHEDCIAQMDRLFRERLYLGTSSTGTLPVPLDEEGRIRVDELEMGQAVQAEIEERFRRIGSADLAELADIEGFKEDFLRAHGFAVEGVDYELDIDSQGRPLCEGLPCDDALPFVNFGPHGGARSSRDQDGTKSSGKSLGRGASTNEASI
jgi:enoyl-[acyl-carrier protein] reductase / trans-2-enoyl-CoA reductase (NAD+)